MCIISEGCQAEKDQVDNFGLATEMGQVPPNEFGRGGTCLSGRWERMKGQVKVRGVSTTCENDRSWIRANRCSSEHVMGESNSAIYGGDCCGIRIGHSDHRVCNPPGVGSVN